MNNDYKTQLINTLDKIAWALITDAATDNLTDWADVNARMSNSPSFAALDKTSESAIKAALTKTVVDALATRINALDHAALTDLCRIQGNEYKQILTYFGGYATIRNILRNA